MKRGQKVGVVTIFMSVLLFVPLLFLFMGTQWWVNGENETASMNMVFGWLGLDTNATFLDALAHLGSASTFLPIFELGEFSPWMWIIQIGTLFMIVFSLVLLVFGILLVCKQVKRSASWMQGLMMLAGGLALVVAIVAIVKVTMMEPMITEGYEQGVGNVVVEARFVIGFGSILMAVMGVFAMVMAIVSSVFKDSESVAIAESGSAQANVSGTVGSDVNTPVKIKGGSAPASVSGLSSLEAELARFKQYKEDGIITEEQYKQKVKEAIDRNLLAE